MICLQRESPLTVPEDYSARSIRRRRLGRYILRLASLVAVSASALAFSAAHAHAFSPRTFEYQIPVKPGPPEQIVVAPANRFLVAEYNKLQEFNALDEKLPKSVEVGHEGWLALDHSTGDLYDPVYGAVLVYSSEGLQLPESTIYKEGHLAVAADNSSAPTAGRLYLTRRPVEGGEPLKIVELLGKSGEAIDFPRYEEPSPPSYISANKLTGTPAAPFSAPDAVAVGPHGEIYVADSSKVDEFESSGVFVRENSGAEVPSPEFLPNSIAVDPTTGDLLVANANVIDEFSQEGAYLGQIKGTGPLQETLFSGLDGIAVNSAGFLYAATSTGVEVFSPSFILSKVTYRGLSGAVENSPTEASAVLSAEVNPDGGGEVKTCEFQYVDEANYNPEAVDPFASSHSVPCSQQLPYSSGAPTQVSAEISNVSPGTTYHYRLLVSNEAGTTEARPRTFDLRAPVISGVAASNLTETTAELTADINPEGGDTTYHFEYGPTTSYGSNAPVPAADIGSFDSDQAVSARLTNLEKGAVYHFRLIAENPIGTVTSEDQTFNFFPPSCPNATVRQQSGTAFLPDCRAYELVSPGDAGGTILFPEGPQSPLATQPSRFAFGGILGEIPEAGGEPPDVRGDLYVATRSDTGWTTRYVGPPATKTLIGNGPPYEAGYIQDSPAGVLTDLKMDQFMDWDDPYNGIAGPGEGPISYAPFLRDPAGHLLGRLPTNLGVVPGGEEVGEQLTGSVKPSPEFNHYFFSSTSALSFAIGSLNHAPGSAYDDNLEENTVTLVSKMADGAPIEEGGGEFIAFPGVSTDGSHILMSTGYSCSSECDPNYDFRGSSFSTYHVNAERHLFMRVGGGQGITYAIAPGHTVHYVGMTPDGSKVYFTSGEKLSSEAEDSSSNLYMWSERGELEGKPLTLISKPNGSSGTGTPVCPPTNWTTECGAVPYLNATARFLPDSILRGGPGGDGLSDNAIAAENGDIYFYSPQQLDGTNGVLGQHNLYDYRGGEVQYVTTFNTGQFCGRSCSEGPLIRIQVSADDSHMAFLTASQITSYDNAGHLEMYTYNPATGNIHCVSCIPDGAPPTSDVEASDNGLFMTEDGRVFFSTADSLVPQDTDGIRDVYEYVGGRPQLISSGTGSREIGVAVTKPPGLDREGLIGVSANGLDVYFSTFDTLVPSDHNGNALKFYDARTDGGFGEPPASAPCAAAEECVGPGSSPPPGAQNGTGAVLGALGNFSRSPSAHAKKVRQKRHHGRQRRHGRRTNSNRGAGK